MDIDKHINPAYGVDVGADHDAVPVPPYAGYIADHNVDTPIAMSTTRLTYLDVRGFPHPDDLAVDRFAAAMKAKLALKRAQGYGGWNDPHECSVARLSAMLIDHVGKGDPVDVGNFAMMIHQRGGRILL